MAELKVEEIIKAVLPEFEIKEDTDIEALRAAHGEKFIDKELHTREIDKIVGKTKGSGETLLRRYLGDEAKDKDYNALQEMLTAKIEAGAKALNDLEAIKTTTSKEKQDLANDLAQLRQALEDNTKLIAEKDAQIQNLNIEWEGKVKGIEMNRELTDLYNKANWTDDSDGIVKTGVWASEIAPKYDFKKEGDKIFVYHKDGKIKMDGSNQMTAERLFETVLKDTKRFKQNGAQAITRKVGKLEIPEVKDERVKAHQAKILEMVEIQKEKQGK